MYFQNTQSEEPPYNDCFCALTEVREKAQMFPEKYLWCPTFSVE